MASTAAALSSVSALSSFAGVQKNVVSRPAGNARSMVVRCQAGQQEKQAMQRRAFFAATAAVVIASVAKEEAKAEEPARGSPEAIKKYKRLCISMPTAAVCHK